MTAIGHVSDVAISLAFGTHSSGLQVTFPTVAAGDTLSIEVAMTGLSVAPAGLTDTASDTWHVSTTTTQNPPTAISSTNVTLVAWCDPVASGGSRTATLTFAGASSGWQFAAQGSGGRFNHVGSEVSGAAVNNGAGGTGAVVSPGALTVPAGGLVIGAALEAFRTVAPAGALTAFGSDTSGATGWAILGGGGTFSPQWSTVGGSAGPTADQSWLACAAVFATADTNTIVVANPGNQAGITSQPVTRTFTATDTGAGQTLTWTATGLPTGLSISSATGTVTGTPSAAGTFSTVITATDTTSSSGFAAFTWTVSASSSGPYGTLLQAIDGGPGYYAGKGFTEAAAAGMDGPNLWPMGIFDAFLSSQSDANRWIDLSLAFAWVINTGLLSVVYPNNPIYMLSVGGNPPSIVSSGGYTPGAETVGQLSADEPAYMMTWEAPIAAQLNNSQDGRWWWANFTISQIQSGVTTSSSDATLVPFPTVLTTTVTTPDSSLRGIDVASSDVYWYAGSNVASLLEAGGIFYGLHRNMLPDEAARGSHYGDQVRSMRSSATALAGGNGAANIPFLIHVENGGPDTANASVSNTTVASGSNGGVIGNIGSWSAPSAGVLAVASTTGFDSAGTLFIATSATLAQVQYTGISGNTFTGCTYISGTPTGTIATGGLVYQSDYITPAQMTQAVWASIIAGVRGLSYFNFTFAGPAESDDNFATAYYSDTQAGQSTSIYAAAKAMDALITTLAPVLYQPLMTNYFTVNPPAVTISPFAADSGIDASARYYTGGGGPAAGAYIFATTRNSQTAPNTAATFYCVDGYSGPVTVVGESRHVTAVNGVFSDTFAAGTTVHIYQVPPVSGGGGGASAAQISDPADDCDHSMAVRMVLW